MQELEFNQCLEMYREKLGIYGHPWLHSEFKFSQSYMKLPQKYKQINVCSKYFQ